MLLFRVSGHGGLFLAANIAQKGHTVKLWNRSPERIAEVKRIGGILVQTGTQKPEGSTVIMVPISSATIEIADVLKDATHILVVISATGHAEVARQCAPYLQDGQSVLILPGRTGGALIFRSALDSAKCKAEILMGEGNTLPIAARTIAPATSFCFGTKSAVQVAALPAHLTLDLLKSWNSMLPMLQGATSVLETGLANYGAILHPIILLMNAKRVRSGEPFDFYTDGVSSKVAVTLADADAERMSIARAYGVPNCSLQAWIEQSYGHRERSLRDAVRRNPSYAGIRAPSSLQHRYLYEDVLTGLLPMIELGSVAGLPLPTLRRIAGAALVTVELGSTSGPLGRSDALDGHTMARMGMENCTVREIVRVASGTTS